MRFRPATRPTGVADHPDQRRITVDLEPSDFARLVEEAKRRGAVWPVYAARMAPGSRKVRVSILLNPEEYAKIDSRAEAMELTPGAIAREIVRAWCAQEPPPIFIGVGEHQ